MKPRTDMTKHFMTNELSLQTKLILKSEGEGEIERSVRRLVWRQSHSTLTGRLWPSHTLLFFSFECGEHLLVCGVKAQAVTQRRHPAPVCW